MLRIIGRILILAFLFLFACTAIKQEKEVVEVVETKCVPDAEKLPKDELLDLGKITLNFNDSIPYYTLPKLTQSEYKKLQLDLVYKMADFDSQGYGAVIDDTIYSGKSGELLTLVMAFSGEMRMYLLSYGQNGQLQDNLLVAYEDIVEFMSVTKSELLTSEISISTIIYGYGESEDKPDTTIVNYQITPELKFVKQ